MRRYPRLKRSLRLRVALLAILALLCQQVAFAAYVCPVLAMPVTHAAMSADCESMPKAAATPDTQSAATLCALHSGQPDAVTNNAQLPSVPPLLLPGTFLVPPSVVVLPATRTAQAHDAAQRTPGLPPPLRYRVLLI